jgi:hypothetical protein
MIAQTYGNKIMTAKLKSERVYDMSFQQAQDFKSKSEALNFKKDLVKKGYDAILINPISYGHGFQIAVFNKSDIVTIEQNS